MMVSARHLHELSTTTFRLVLHTEEKVQIQKIQKIQKSNKQKQKGPMHHQRQHEFETAGPTKNVTLFSFVRFGRLT